MTIKKMLFEVEVHRTHGFDCYRVLAVDDIVAREKAIDIDNNISLNVNCGEIVYCEITLISKVDK